MNDVLQLSPPGVNIGEYEQRKGQLIILSNCNPVSRRQTKDFAKPLLALLPTDSRAANQMGSFGKNGFHFIRLRKPPHSWAAAPVRPVASAEGAPVAPWRGTSAAPASFRNAGFSRAPARPVAPPPPDAPVPPFLPVPCNATPTMTASLFPGSTFRAAAPFVWRAVRPLPALRDCAAPPPSRPAS